jgi:hypothetical protein
MKCWLGLRRLPILRRERSCPCGERWFLRQKLLAEKIRLSRDGCWERVEVLGRTP